MSKDHRVSFVKQPGVTATEAEAFVEHITLTRAQCAFAHETWGADYRTNPEFKAWLSRMTELAKHNPRLLDEGTMDVL